MTKLKTFIDYISDMNSDRIYMGSVTIEEDEYKKLTKIINSIFPQLALHDKRKDKNYIRKMKTLLSGIDYEYDVVAYDAREKYSSISGLNPLEESMDNYLKKIGENYRESDASGDIYIDWNKPIYKLYNIPSGVKLYSVDSNREPGMQIADFLTWTTYIKQRQSGIYSKFKDQLVTFQEWIKKFPLLGASDPTGQSIIKAVQKRLIPILQIDSEVWFRVREVSSSNVFKVEDMHAPKPEFVRKEGRYNHIGIPVFYLSSDLDTSISEIMEIGDERVLWSQKFKLKGLNVLDLTVPQDPELDIKQSELELLIAALLHEGVVDEDIQNRDSPWKPEYYIPRFVADVAKAYGGVDGIRYNSNRGNGFNLALFSWEGKVEPLDKPEVGRHLRKEFVNEVVIETPPWQNNLWDMTCICGETISQSQRVCPYCHRTNGYFMMDDDL